MKKCLLLLFCLCSIGAFAQNSRLGCGTELPDLSLPNAKLLPSCTYGSDGYGSGCGRDCIVPSQNCGLLRVPIVITIITNGSGGGAINTADLNANLAELNATYADANIVFYESQARRTGGAFDSADFYDFDNDNNSSCPGGTDDDDNQIGIYDIPNVINIYFTGDVKKCGGTICGYAYYPGTLLRSVMANNCIGVGEATLAHELGHFFGLRHTHEGNSNTNGAPIDNNSDCCTTGDRICDTGADPKLDNSIASQSCSYSGTPQPDRSCGCYTALPSGTTYSGCFPGGTPSPCDYNGPANYNPDMGNLMSYNPWGGCQRDHFSPCQLAKVYDVP